MLSVVLHMHLGVKIRGGTVKQELQFCQTHSGGPRSAYLEVRYQSVKSVHARGADICKQMNDVKQRSGVCLRRSCNGVCTCQSWFLALVSHLRADTASRKCLLCLLSKSILLEHLNDAVSNHP